MGDTEATEAKFPQALQQHIGYVRMLASEPSGRVRVEYEGRPEFTHSEGTTVQGGILTAWLDHAMARAIAARDAEAGLASLEIKVSFLARVPPGPCVAEARIVKWGRTVAFLEAELIAVDGTVMTRASSTGMLVRPRKD